MMNKLKDLTLLLQKDKKTQIFGGIFVVLVLFMLFAPEPTRRNQVRLNKEGSGSSGPDDAYNDIVRAFGTELDSVKSEVKDIKATVEEQGQNFQEFEQRTADIFKKMLERMAEGESTRQTGDSADPTTVQDPDAAQVEADQLQSFGDEKDAPAPPAPPAPQHVAFVGAGDSVRIKLLAGVNAPTDGTPYPVVFELVDDIQGPDSSQLPLGEARLIAAAQGSLTDSRALFRLTSLNLRLPNGRRKVLPVDGWVVGEDGIRGMEGVLIDPIGKAIAGAGAAGFLEGIGEGVSASNATITTGAFGNSQSFVSGSVAEFAAGQGVSKAAKSYGRIIEKRISELVPVVQVLSGREATAVFSKSFAVTDLMEALEDEDSTAASLD